MRLVIALIIFSFLIVFISREAFVVLPSYFYESIILLFLGTVGIYFYMIDIKRNRPEYFVQLYIATLVVKILAYGGYVLYVVWDDRSQATNNALIFMITYFIFTAIEVVFLYQKVNR